MIDYSFIRLTQARINDNPPIAEFNYQGMIMQKIDETFCQKTSSSTDIVFVGDILVELIDNCGNVKKDITDNFFYYGYEDARGIKQIDFEFGNIGEDFSTTPLFLKITDTDNGNIWYSNNFLVTNYRSQYSSRFDYTNRSAIFNIDYTTSQRTQSIRFSECYDFTPANERNQKQYTTSQGKKVNYRNIVTFGRKYKFSNIDYFNNDRLEVLFSHDTIYLNNDRVVVSDFKPSERVDMSNWFDGEFVINPQNEPFNFEYQIYEGLEVIELYPPHESIYTPTSGLYDGYATITFNKNMALNSGFEATIYKDGVLLLTRPIEQEIILNRIFANFTDLLVDLEVGVYNIVFPSGCVDVFDGKPYGSWTFTIVDGEFDGTEFDGTEFLTT